MSERNSDMTGRYAERFTFTPDDRGYRWLRCIDCHEPLGSWHPEQIELMLTELGQSILRETAAAHDRAVHPGPDVPATPPITSGESLAPTAWCIRYGLTMISRDGWRQPPKPWMEPVTLPEFARRAVRCTQDLAAWVRFVETVPKSAREEPAPAPGPLVALTTEFRECECSLIRRCEMCREADEEIQRDPNSRAAIPATYTATHDVNPVCGCHLGARCDGCGVCTTCDGCYCGEDR